MALTLEEQVVAKLKDKQYILSTVESCTGGLISNLITNVAGASSVFFGATVVYDNGAKQELGVPAPVIAEKGAVSPEVAHSLAENGLKKLQNNPFLSQSYALLKPKGFICVSTTGIAGPSGGSKEKPLGLCYLGLALSHHPIQVEAFQIPAFKDRVDSKLQFAHQALEMILNSLQT